MDSHLTRSDSADALLLWAIVARELAPATGWSVNRIANLEGARREGYFFPISILVRKGFGLAGGS